MNVFVLSSGRCGSTTFIHAASHIRNYRSGHESRARCIGAARFAYPPDHIESDNRLAWMLGRLEAAFGGDALYVHLTRDAAAVARSFDRRWKLKDGIITAYRNGILLGAQDAAPYDVCLDLVHTIDFNIQAFIANKPRKMSFRLEAAKDNWRDFWDRIGADGDLAASLKEWDVMHNATPRSQPLSIRALHAVSRAVQSIR